MINIPPGKVMSRYEVQEIFQCSLYSGMNRSLRTNTLVLITNHTSSLYYDRWEGEILYFTGMGRSGDQSLQYLQNRTLYESDRNGVEIHYFEVFSPSQYTYIGKMKLAGEPFQEYQLDENNKLRKVWVFPLKCITGVPFIDLDTIDEKNRVRDRMIKKLSDEILLERARTVTGKPSTRTTISITFDRDSAVAEYAKRWARGICQLCEQPAPFINKNGEPHLHTHHIEWLSRGGEDTIENTVAVCPNCHDRLHYLDLPEDVNKLRLKVLDHLKSLS